MEENLFHEKLTKRETEVLNFLDKNRHMRTKEIARSLFISRRTAESYMYRLYMKFEVHSKKKLLNKLDIIRKS